MIAPQLIIFDCDGTLVDSEHLNNKATADVLAGLGLPQYDTEYCLRHFAGKSMTEMAAFILAETGVALPADFVTRYAALVQARMKDELRAIPGVKDVLTALARDVLMCVGSNGERTNVLTSLAMTGLDRYFPDSMVFTKNMVQRPKPAPDLFLFAADALRADPAMTVVVEDSITGTTAGVAAGMTVIGFTGTYHDKAAQAANLRAAGAAEVIDDFTRLLDLLNFAAPELSTGT